MFMLTPLASDWLTIRPVLLNASTNNYRSGN